jgi:phage shock protein E
MHDRNSEGFSTITPEEARFMMDDGDVVILDVREPSEFATGHVPGAINVPLGEIRMGRTLPECPDLDKTVLIYCRSGRRSDIGGRIMASSGYRDVRNFLGVIQWPYELVR